MTLEINTPEKVKLYQKKYYEENKEKVKLNHKKWVEKNKEKVRLFQKKFREKLKQNKRQYKMHRLRMRLSTGIRMSLKKILLGKSFKNLLEFSLDSLKKSLEKKMTKGMSWENFDKYDIDHMIPHSWFKLENTND